jgi:hypothetical protein
MGVIGQMDCEVREGDNDMCNCLLRKKYYLREKICVKPSGGSERTS